MIRIFLAILSAILLILSFPKFDLEFLAWIALVPLLVSIKNKSLKSAFCLCFLTGISFFEGVFYWANVVEGFKLLDALILGVYLGSYFGIFGLLLNFISKKSRFPFFMTAPVLWMSIEYLRSNAGFLGLPWALLGHSQYLNLLIIQISSFTGAYGVSFLIVMINVTLSEIMIYMLFKREGNFDKGKEIIFTSAVAIIILLTSCSYGFSVLARKPKSENIKVTVIQGNILFEKLVDQEIQKKIVDKQVELTKAAIKDINTSLIVWPEGAIRGYIENTPYLFNTISTLAKEKNTCLLVGSSRRPKFGSKEIRKTKLFNSAYVISPKGIIERQYNKIRLLPFAEYLPYKDILPWPSRYVEGVENFIPGNTYTIFDLADAKFGVTICWENIFPDLFREFVKKGANFMINITNEAWFDETSAPYQFLSMSVFRAVENRVSVIRSANTGISCFITPYGEIIGRVGSGKKDIFVEGYLTKEIPLAHKKTFYTLYGDIFAYVNLSITIFVLFLSLIKIRRS